MVKTRAVTAPYPHLGPLVGSFEPGYLYLVDSSSPLLFDLLAGLVASTAISGRVAVLDGGNCVDVYRIADEARRLGISPREILPRVSIARAFTAHQMSALVEDSLPELLEADRCELVVIASLADTYLDRDVRFPESNALVRRAMVSLREIARRYRVPLVVTNYGAARLHRRAVIRRSLYGADRVIKIIPQGNATRIEHHPDGRAVFYRTCDRGQMKLDCYRGGV